MRRFVVVLLMCTIGGSMTYSAATSLPVSADKLGSGAATGLSIYNPCVSDGVDLSYVFEEERIAESVEEHTAAVADDSAVKEVPAVSVADKAAPQATHLLVSVKSGHCQGERVAIHLFDGERNPLATVSTTLSAGTVELALGRPLEVEPGLPVIFELDHLVAADDLDPVSVNVAG